MKIPIKKLSECTLDLTCSYWEQWCKITDKFPDIEEVSYLKLLLVQSSLLHLICDYLLGYDRDDRKIYLEDFIAKLRILEMNLDEES